MNFKFDSVQRFVVGTVGMPGEREFFLQLRTAGELRSFKLEKAQAAALAERMREIIREVKRRYGIGYTLQSNDDAPLESPVESEFAIGSMSRTWDEDESSLLFSATEIPADIGIDDESEAMSDGLSTVEAKVTLDQAAEFARRTIKVVEAGRRPCTFCGSPLDPSGHLCPRANGYRR